MDWGELKSAVIAGLDIIQEYKQLGVKFVEGAEPRSSGWLPCHAVDREDRSPSAAVKIDTGHYRDLGGDNDSLSLWDFAVKHGPYADWKEAFQHYAKTSKVSKKKFPKSWENQPAEKVEILKYWNPLTVRGFRKLYPKVTEEAILATGATIARYPKKSSTPRYCLQWPIYGTSLLDEPPTGHVIQAADSGLIEKFRGKELPPEPTKRLVLGKSGLVGRSALKLFSADPSPVERIYKVEGISDLLALQSIIPAEFREKHIVITNAAGAGEHQTPKDFAHLFAGTDLVIIHDSDEPGQNGAKLWLNYVGKYCKVVRNVILDDEIEAKHGKDLRDWLKDRTYDDLCSLVDMTNLFVLKQPTDGTESAAAPGATGDTLNDDQAILKRLGIVVLGHSKTTSKITIFTESDGRTWKIGDLKRYGNEDLFLHVGRDIIDLHVNLGEEPDPQKLTIKQIRYAIGAEANRRRIVDEKQLGTGIWEVSGRLALVGAGEALLWNGELTRTVVPFTDDQLFDFDGEPWFSEDWLADKIELSDSPAWCEGVFSEADDLFARWDNWRYDDMPTLIASLICCTWLQTVWPIRPLVAVAGPTNSGKTILLETIKGLFGSLALSVSKPSEAGIRQFVGHTAKILLVDEFEADQHRAKILELFRTSSRGQEVIRGSASQQGVRFGLRHIPWVGAIELGLQDAAEANRFIQLELTERDKSKGSQLVVPPDGELADLGLRLMVVGMRNWKRALSLLQPLKSHNWGSHDLRLVEIYSVPVAMLAAILGQSDEEARGLLNLILEARGDESDIETDESALLGEIFQSDVFMGRGHNETVGNLLGELPDNNNESALERNGIAMKTIGGSQYLFLATAIIRRKLLQRVKSGEKNIGQILKRLPGAKPDRHRINGTRPHGILIPMETIKEMFGSDDGSQVF
jgi:hypothetical protein